MFLLLAACLLKAIAFPFHKVNQSVTNTSTIENARRYAPVVWLHSKESYFPGDIAEYISHFDVIDFFGYKEQFSGNISHLNLFRKPSYSLETDNWDGDWITGAKPTNQHTPAPAILIIIDNGDEWVDAYWFYFYPFNLGPCVRGHGPVGNHLGDWEHTIVRFHRDVPRKVFLSCHNGGTWYFYQDMIQFGTHPVVYSAIGSHANYASGGRHYRDPTGSLFDDTNHGHFWNPVLNHLTYTFDGTRFQGFGDKEKNYGEWLTFQGRWGNRRLSIFNPKQRFYGPKLWRYVDGPRGPISKIQTSFKWWQRG